MSVFGPNCGDYIQFEVLVPKPDRALPTRPVCTPGSLINKLFCFDSNVALTITPIVTPIAPARKHIQSTCTGGNASIVSYPPADATKKKVARKYNLGRKGDQFCEGNLVRCRLHLSSPKDQNISAKRLLRWSTPVKNVRKFGPNVVLLADPHTGSIVRRAHVSHLRPCVK